MVVVCNLGRIWSLVEMFCWLADAREIVAGTGTRLLYSLLIHFILFRQKSTTATVQCHSKIVAGYTLAMMIGTGTLDVKMGEKVPNCLM